MIKKVFKYFLTFCAIGLGIVNFSSAVDYIQNVGYNYYNPFTINISGYGNVDYNITTKGNFSTTYNGITYDKFLYFRSQGSADRYYLILGRKNGKLYGFVKTENSRGYSQYIVNIQGYFDKFAIVESGYNFDYTNSNKYELSLTFDDIISYLNSNNIIGFHGSNGNDNSNKTNANGNFMRFSQNYISDWCLITDNEENPYLCFFHSTTMTNDSNYKPNLTGSLDFSVNDFSSIASFLGFFDNSPIVGGGGNGGITVNYGSGAILIGSDESAINYYEKTYGWDEKICYVGVDNYTDLYGTRVSFDEGSGLNIFQVFSGLYGNTDLNKVYVWLNTWLINYDERFIRYQRNGLTPTYFATYNSGTNQVDLYYTGLDVSPFVNKPVALYFMANNIYDRSPYKTMGSSVVSYCNLKINSGSFEQIIDQSDKNNIDNYSENSNQNIGLNPDGTVKDIIDYGYFSGDAFEFSGSDLSFSGGNSVKTSLIGFFDFVSNLFSYSNSSSSSSGTRGIMRTNLNPIIPSYIIWGLILVILFKVFKRR